MEDSNCIKILCSDLHKRLRETEMIDFDSDSAYVSELRRVDLIVLFFEKRLLCCCLENNTFGFK